MNEYLILFIRSVVTYFILVIFARIMGRKQISQLTYFDYVVGITIGSIASTASVEKNVNMYEGIFCIIIWSLLTIVISEINIVRTLHIIIQKIPSYISTFFSTDAVDAIEPIVIPTT